MLGGAPLGQPGGRRAPAARGDGLGRRPRGRGHPPADRLASRPGCDFTGRLVSFYESAEQARPPELLAALRATAAPCCSSPTPACRRSRDPGYRLVRAAIEAGVPVTSVPGPSAVTTALAVSGLPVDRFCFEGFLPRKAGERAARLAELADERRTMVFFESPHRLADALAALAAAFGADRPAAVCRELTKTYEEVRRGTLAELAAWAADGVRGEITLVVAGAPERVAVLDAGEAGRGGRRRGGRRRHPQGRHPRCRRPHRAAPADGVRRRCRRQGRRPPAEMSPCGIFGWTTRAPRRGSRRGAPTPERTRSHKSDITPVLVLDGERTVERHDGRTVTSPVMTWHPEWRKVLAAFAAAEPPATTTRLVDWYVTADGTPPIEVFDWDSLPGDVAEGMRAMGESLARAGGARGRFRPPDADDPDAGAAHERGADRPRRGPDPGLRRQADTAMKVPIGANAGCPTAPSRCTSTTGRPATCSTSSPSPRPTRRAPRWCCRWPTTRSWPSARSGRAGGGDAAADPP